MKHDELNTVPVITNINKEKDKLEELASRSLELDIHASDIYNLLNGRDLISKSEYTAVPLIM